MKVVQIRFMAQAFLPSKPRWCGAYKSLDLYEIYHFTASTINRLEVHTSGEVTKSLVLVCDDTSIIRFCFSTEMDRRSCQKSIFISLILNNAKCLLTIFFKSIAEF